MAETPEGPDALERAFNNPEFQRAFRALVAGQPIKFDINAFEQRYKDRPALAPERPQTEAGELHDLIGRVLSATAGDRHNPLTALALYYAHRLRSHDELRTTLLAFMEGRPYADMMEGHPSEFDKITRTAWEKARDWRARRPADDIADQLEGPPDELEGAPIIEVQDDFEEPPASIDLAAMPLAVEHHVWPVVQRFVSNIIAGPGGSNKTAFATLLAVATAAERPDLLWQVDDASDDDQPLVLFRYGAVLAIDLDGQPGAFESRVAATLKLHSLKASDLKHPIYLYKPRKHSNLFHLVERSPENWFKVEQGRQLVKLAKWIKAKGLEFALTILDTFGRAHPFPMIEDTAAREAVAVADRFADYFGTAFVIISHTAADVADSDDLSIRKRKGLATGSTAIESTARSNAGMLPMGIKDAQKRGVVEDRAKNLLGLTLRKANDAKEGDWFWFERYIVPIPARQRDGQTRVVEVPALKRAYHVGVALSSPVQQPKSDPEEAERRFPYFMVKALQGQGRMSVTAAADRYISRTPSQMRVATARSTVRDRCAELPLNMRVDMGEEGHWFLHCSAITAKRREVWADTEESMI